MTAANPNPSNESNTPSKELIDILNSVHELTDTQYIRLRDAIQELLKQEYQRGARAMLSDIEVMIQRLRVDLILELEALKGDE